MAHRKAWQDDGMAGITHCDGVMLPAELTLVAPDGPMAKSDNVDDHAQRCSRCGKSLVLWWGVRIEEREAAPAVESAHVPGRAPQRVDDAIKVVQQRIDRLEDVQRCAQSLLATIVAGQNANQPVSALIPHTKQLVDAMAAACGGA